MLVYLAGGGGVGWSGVLVGQICGVWGRNANARIPGGMGRSREEWSSSGADMRGLGAKCKCSYTWREGEESGGVLVGQIFGVWV